MSPQSSPSIPAGLTELVLDHLREMTMEIGRASCRERV